MVGRVPSLSSPPVVPFPSFLPANLLRACPSGRRASVPLCHSNLSPLCFHTLTNCFSRNPFVFTLICVAPGVTPSLLPPVRLSGVRKLICSALPAEVALCFHTLTNPFFRNPFLFTSMQNPRGCGVEILGTDLLFSVLSVPLRQIHSFQAFAASLPSFSASRPLFSIVCSLFSQNTGGGVSRMHLRDTRVGVWSKVGSLKKEDFQLFDRDKEQAVSGFSIQTRAAVESGTVTSRTFVVTAPIC